MNREHRTTTARRRARQLIDFERRVNEIFGRETSISITSGPIMNAEEAGPSEVDGTAENDETGKKIDFLKCILPKFVWKRT